MRTRHSQDVVDEVVRRYIAHEDIRHIGLALGIHPATVSRYAKKAGVTRNKQYSEDIRSRAATLYATGLGVKVVGRILGIPHQNVYTWVREDGIVRGRVAAGLLKSAAHPMSWGELTPSRAWVLGLIYGDGGIRADQGAATLSVDAIDVDILDKVCAVFGHKFGVSRRTGCLQLNISSSAFCKSLKRDYGLDEHKCTNMPWPQLDAVFLPHFVRGLWDSDGSWHWRGGRQSHLCVASYNSVSGAFVSRLQSEIALAINVCPRPIRETLRKCGQIDGRDINSRSSFVVEYSHFDAVSLGAWMYAGCTEGIRGVRKHHIWSIAASVPHRQCFIDRHARHREKLRAVSP